LGEEAELASQRLMRPEEVAPTNMRNVTPAADAPSVELAKLPGAKEIEPKETKTELMNVRPQQFINRVSDPGSHVNSEVVNNYRAQIRAGQPLEPLETTMDENGNVLSADGRHRALAAMQEGQETVPVKVTRVLNKAPLKITTGPMVGHEVPPEHTTGVPESDAAIKVGGGIPGGKFLGLHMFHDPES